MRDKRANLALVLKTLRQERGLFQSDLAVLAGVPQPFVSRLERGEQDLTVVTNALRVIRALNLPSELLDRVLELGPAGAETGGRQLSEAQLGSAVRESQQATLSRS